MSYQSYPKLAEQVFRRVLPNGLTVIVIQRPGFQRKLAYFATDFGSIHRDFIRDHVTLVGCPKLDGIDYSMKLTHILKNNDIRSVTVVRMEVPCCGGIEFAVKKALQASGTMIPWNVVTISTDGRIVDRV